MPLTHDNPNGPRRRFIVVSSVAKMPKSVKSRYRHVAVIELANGFLRHDYTPPAIDERCRGVKRVVHRWERLHVSRGGRGIYADTLAEAQQLAASLNAGREDLEAYDRAILHGHM